MTDRRPLARFLAACERRPRLAATGALAYAIAVTATHDHVQDLAYFLQRTFTPEVWRPLVAGAAALALAVACAAARVRIAESPVRAAAAASWWGICALLAAAFVTLLATNMEAVHFVQYAILAWPALALTGTFARTVVVVTILGAADEAWQYAVLHSDWDVPFDVNDVVLNALGACLGCASALVFAQFRPRVAGMASALAPAVLFAAVVCGGGVLAVRAGAVALHPEDGPAPVLLSRGPRPADRWETPDWGRGHHVLHPGAAAVILAALVALAGAADRRASR